MKQVVLYAALLGAALVGSYLTWTSDGAGILEDGGVAVYSASEGDVTALAFDDEKLDVKAERRSDENGDYVWITIDEIQETKIKSPHDHGAKGEDTPDAPAGPEAPPEDPEDLDPDEVEGDGDDDGETEPEPEPEIKVEHIHHEFLGNDNAAGLFKGFEPLVAIRHLETTSADLEAFGLTDSTKQIRVTRAAGETVISLGGQTYGSKDHYAQYEGKVMLLEDTTIRPLQFAETRLQERRPHPLLASDTDSLELTQPGGESLTYVQQNKDDRAAAYWARSETPEDTDDAAGTWVQKFFRLKVQKHEVAEDLPEMLPVVIATVVSGKQRWQLEIFEEVDGDRVFAQSSYNRATVELTRSLAAEALADLEDLFQD